MIQPCRLFLKYKNLIITDSRLSASAAITIDFILKSEKKLPYIRYLKQIHLYLYIYIRFSGLGTTLIEMSFKTIPNMLELNPFQSTFLAPIASHMC